VLARPARARTLAPNNFSFQKFLMLFSAGNQSGGVKQGLGKSKQIGVLRKHERESV